MTNEEKDAIEGRIRRTLREAKQNVVALQTEIEEYAVKLSEASETIRHFLKQPFGVGPTGKTGSEYVLHFFSDLIPPGIGKKLRELEQESGRVIDLEQKIKEFGE